MNEDLLKKYRDEIEYQIQRNRVREEIEWMNLLRTTPSAVYLGFRHTDRGEWVHNKAQKIYKKTDLYCFVFLSIEGIHGLD